jgi:hypothetical protein
MVAAPAGRAAVVAGRWLAAGRRAGAGEGRSADGLDAGLLAARVRAVRGQASTRQERQCAMASGCSAAEKKKKAGRERNKGRRTLERRTILR